MDSIVPMAFGNLALDFVLKGRATGGWWPSETAATMTFRSTS